MSGSATSLEPSIVFALLAAGGATRFGGRKLAANLADKPVWSWAVNAAAAAGFGYLGLEPVLLGDLAIVGICGWYDFGFRDPGLEGSVSLHHYRAGQWRDVRAFDRGQILWPRSSLAEARPGTLPATDRRRFNRARSLRPRTEVFPAASSIFLCFL